MPKKQLTTSQIQELHNLVQRNAIKYYDVEIEIVDHYASAIEAIWEKEPEVSFYQARERVYKELWDFQGIEQEKIRQVTKQANKNIWIALKSMFVWPKLVELLLLFSICWFSLTYFKSTAWGETGYVYLLFLSLMILPILLEGTTLRNFDKNRNKHFLSLYRVTTTYSFFLVLAFSLADMAYRLPSLLPCAFLLAIYFLGMKDMHFLFKEERRKIKQRYT